MAGLALLVLSLVAVVAVFLVFTRDDDELEEGDGERDTIPPPRSEEQSIQTGVERRNAFERTGSRRF